MDIQRLPEFLCHSCAQEEKNKTYVMNKVKINVLREVLPDVPTNFVGTEEYIRKKLEEICSREKISTKQVIYFCLNTILVNKASSTSNLNTIQY